MPVCEKSNIVGDKCPCALRRHKKVYILLDALSEVVAMCYGIEYPHWNVIWVGIFPMVQNQVHYLLMRP